MRGKQSALGGAGKEAREKDPLLPSTVSDADAASSKLLPLRQPPWTSSLFSKANVAVVSSYLIVGACSGILSTPLSVYLVNDLGASPMQQSAITAILTAPWSFKLIYGFVSDTWSIWGYRRKSYLAIGAGIYSLSMSVLALMTEPSLEALAVLLFVATIGLTLADVSADTMVVERSRYEPQHKKGKAQATCYTVRFAGGIIGSLGSCVLYNKDRWGWGLTFSQVCALCASLPLALLVPAIPFLHEFEGEPKSVRRQVADIWRMVQLKAVWRPMTFIYCYNLLQTPNVAWNSYLQLTLNFPAWFLGMITLVGSVMTFLGIVIYKRFFMKSSWRSIYVVSSVLTTAFSCMQLMLIFQWNERYLHIPNYPFAMGDDVLQQFLAGIQFLPSCVMYMVSSGKASRRQL